MKTHLRIRLLVALAALFLDPSYGQVVVQPGYDRSSENGGKESVASPKTEDASPISSDAQYQDPNVGSPQQRWQNAYQQRMRQQQLYQQQLQRQRQMQQAQMQQLYQQQLQLQRARQQQMYQEQLYRYQQARMYQQQMMLGQAQPQDPTVGQPQKQEQTVGEAQKPKEVVGAAQKQEPIVGNPQNENVGTTRGLLYRPKAFGAKSFGLGPLGLYGAKIGGIGAGAPLLLAPNPQSEKTAGIQSADPEESKSNGKSESGDPKRKSKRDVDGRREQPFRHQSAVYERNGVASDKAVESNAANSARSSSTEKIQGDIVGGAKKDDEVVGTRMSQLDPFNLAGKTEELLNSLSVFPLPGGGRRTYDDDKSYKSAGDNSRYDYDDDMINDGRYEQGVNAGVGRQHDYYSQYPSGYHGPQHSYHGQYGPTSGYYGPQQSYHGGNWHEQSGYLTDLVGSTHDQTNTVGRSAGNENVNSNLMQSQVAGFDPSMVQPSWTPEMYSALFQRTDNGPAIQEAPLGLRLTDGVNFYRVISSPTSVDNNWSQQFGESQPMPFGTDSINAVPGQSYLRGNEQYNPNWAAQMMGFQPMPMGANAFPSSTDAYSMTWAKSAPSSGNAMATPLMDPSGQTEDAKSLPRKPATDVIINEHRDSPYMNNFGLVPGRPVQSHQIYEDRTIYNNGYGARPNYPVRIHDHHQSVIY